MYAEHFQGLCPSTRLGNKPKGSSTNLCRCQLDSVALQQEQALPSALHRVCDNYLAIAVAAVRLPDRPLKWAWLQNTSPVEHSPNLEKPCRLGNLWVWYFLKACFTFHLTEVRKNHCSPLKTSHCHGAYLEVWVSYYAVDSATGSKPACCACKKAGRYSSWIAGIGNTWGKFISVQNRWSRASLFTAGSARAISAASCTASLLNNSGPETPGKTVFSNRYY